jgi:hypothetical protein
MKKHEVHPMPPVKRVDSEHIEFEGKLFKFVGKTIQNGDLVFEGVDDGVLVFYAPRFLIADLHPKGKLPRSAFM